MTDASGDLHFSQRSVLRDGTPVHIRVMRPDDRDKLVAAFGKLQRQSIYTRFFSYTKELSETLLSRIDAIDFIHTAALVVTVGAGADETIIASASYISDTVPDGAPVPEVAFTITEDYQGQGLAGTLLAALVGIARRHGIARFKAEVLAGNAPMLSVFRRSGLPMTRSSEDDVVHIVLDLGQERA